ncbi:unnamed protein product [Schistosoma margrebowiei]|uniref:Uncharacterized protein n=1 Tax=Schistosoma margrebowiei TaxID=48269 RepID=A0A183LZ25_9TREM|nr:unnamed protein product [Schistosoma margrebowiei]
MQHATIGSHLTEKTFAYLDRITDEHGGSDTDSKAQIGKTRTAYPQLKNICYSKQLSTDQHQSHNFQYKCQNSSTVWGRHLVNCESHHPEHTNA